MSQQSCPYCGNWNFEEEDGILVCTSCGRQQEGGLQVADDEPEFGNLGKIVRKKVEKTRVKVSKIYRGPKAYRLYVLAWQHVLWKQCHAMVYDVAKAPPELWDVVRDLWGLQLASLTVRLQKPERQISERESSGVEDSLSELEESEEKTSQGVLRPKLVESVGLLYLGCILLRVPISLHAMYELILHEEIPYVRAIRHVPTTISSKLPSEYQEALDTNSIPTAMDMQQSINRFARQYCIDHGIGLPLMNWRVVLFDWIQHLCLPIEIYDAVSKLAIVVGYDFAYHSPENDSSTVSTKGRRVRRSPVDYPEAQLICLIVIAVKVLFPFPGSKRATHTQTHTSWEEIPPSSYADSSASMITVDWLAWLKVQRSFEYRGDHDQPRNLRSGEHISVEATDIQSLSAEALDEYMGWYQRTFATPQALVKEKKSDLEYGILSMFPVSSPDNAIDPTKTVRILAENENNLRDRVRATQSQAILSGQTFTLSMMNNGDTNQTIGDTTSADQSSLAHSKYLVFPDIEALQATTSCFENDSSSNPIIYFHEQAAAVSCLGVKGLLKAVRYTERKLEGWATQRRREEAFRE